MSSLTPAQLAELRRWAFLVVDGLWFLGVEQRLGFEETLAVRTGHDGHLRAPAGGRRPGWEFAMPQPGPWGDPRCRWVIRR